MKNNDYNLRQKAIRRYLGGEKPVNIYKDLDKSKSWFFKWLKKYHQSKEQNWFSDQSKTPVNQPFKINTEIETTIVNVRKKLVNTKYAHMGAATILWELEKLGIPEKDIPSIPTIDRIIRRNNLVISKQSTKKNSNKNYPSPVVTTFNDVQQCDIVGRRYIRGDKGTEGFYSYHLKELYSHYLKLKQYLYRDSQSVIDFFVNIVWKTLGFSKILQIDNLLIAKGSNLHPGYFGNLIKLCLMFGIEILFIPCSEPWRIGVIESFNNYFNKKFLRSQIFSNLDHLKIESENFENFYNAKRPNSALSVKEHGSKLPAEVFKRFNPELLSKDFNLNDFVVKGRLAIPLTDGKVSFIRWIKEDLKLNIFGETFKLTKPLANEYIKATIYVKEQVLRVSHEEELISEFKYISY